MALSSNARKALEIALANSESAPNSTSKEVADAIDTGGNPQGAAVADIGATSNISAAALSTSDTYTDAAVNAELDSLMGEVESRMDAAEAKIDALLGSLRSAEIIAT